MFSIQHTLLTTCYANMSCVFVDVCVVSVTLSLLMPPPPFSSRLACYPLAWGGVWQRDNPCRYVPLTPRCSCLLRILGELGRLPVSLSLSPTLFFFCYNYSSGHMLPQFTAELMVFVRPTHPGSGCVKVIWSSALEASLPGSQSDSGAARCDAGSPAGVWRSRASLTPGLNDFIWHKQEMCPEKCIHATNLKTNKENNFSPTVFICLSVLVIQVFPVWTCLNRLLVRIPAGRPGFDLVDHLNQAGLSLKPATLIQVHFKLIWPAFTPDRSIWLIK